MILGEYNFNQDNGFNVVLDSSMNSSQTLVLLFSNAEISLVNHVIQAIRSQLPDAIILGCSTSGQIHNSQLSDHNVLLTVIKLEKTRIKKASVADQSSSCSFESGKQLSQQLNAVGLKYIMLLSKGLNINGSQLAEGVRADLGQNVVVTGGLAGDDDRFLDTWVINQDNQCDSDAITAVGFYGEDIHVSFGSQGGWQPIGPFRTITESTENTLMSIDGQPALSIYSKYLGKLADELPASGLLFPLAIFDKDNTASYKVRTILGVDVKNQSIEFAGDVPSGSKVKLMHASFDRLVAGATAAGSQLESLNETQSQGSLCLLISCVGRRLVLGQRTEEEIDEVVESLPKNTLHAGFYSYGELTPSAFRSCELHNQTMTLTLLWEC